MCLFFCIWHHGFYQIPTDCQLTNWLPLLENLPIGHGWIFHQDNDTKQTSKSTQKWILPLPPQSSDLNPKISGVNWEERHQHGSQHLKHGEILYSRMVSDQVICSMIPFHNCSHKTQNGGRLTGLWNISNAKAMCLFELMLGHKITVGTWYSTLLFTLWLHLSLIYVWYTLYTHKKYLMTHMHFRVYEYTSGSL